ncbi:MAG TPA: M1 family metallopeptidase [Opitutaceae bacterium]
MYVFPPFVSRLVIACALVLLAAAGRGEEPFRFETTPGQLPKNTVPRHYTLRLTPDLEKRTIAGTARIDFEVRTPVTEILLNALELEIDSAALVRPDGTQTPLTHRLDPEKQTLALTLTSGLAAGDYTVEIAYRGKINDQAQGVFIDKYPTATGDKFMIGTQMEATDARRVFPGWDEPVFRATYDLTLVLPEKFIASANMPALRETTLPDGRKETVFARTPSMPTYLVAIFAGEFDVLAEEHDGIQLRILTTEGKRESARYAMEVTKQVLDYFHTYFGLRYPLPKLDQIAVPNAFSGFGAMENWGAISYMDTYILVDPAASSQTTREDVYKTIAHEIAHQWFGNIVTMAWWDNLWLNEGFASWMEMKATDALNPEWSVWLRANAEKEAAMGLDVRKSTHPIQTKVETEGQAFSAFDTISYLKGQAFIRMLEAYLGETAFRDGIRLYLKRHAYSNTTTADLWAALSEASGKPVAQVAAEWTEQPGFPIVSLRAIGEGAQRKLEATQTRFTLGAPHTEIPTWKIPLTSAPLEAISRTQVDLITEPKVTLPWPAGAKAIKANVGDTGFYRVYYDEPLLAALQDAIATLPIADQLNLLSDTWALVRAGRTTTPAYLTLAGKLNASQSEPVWTNILTTLKSIDAYQQGQPGRRAFQAWSVRTLTPLLQRLGWQPVPGESPLTGTLRADVIDVLGCFGDETVIAKANQLFQGYAQNPESIPGDLREPVLFIVGRYANQTTYDQLHALAKRALTTEEKRRLYRAMQAALDPALARQTLALSLGDSMPVSERNHNVRRVAILGEQAAVAWEFAQANFDTLAKSLTSFERYDYAPDIMNAFYEAARADELEAFMKANFPEEAAASGARVAEAIRDRAAFRARELAALDAWVKTQAPVPER